MKFLMCVFFALSSVFALADGSVTDLGNGSVKFEVKFSGNQQYVELFVRQNGIQNIATAITGSKIVNADGTYSYSFTKSGYAVGDVIEYRFYSYVPAGAAVFTPGPIEGVWYSYTYNATFKSQDGNYKLGAQVNAAGKNAYVSVFQQQSIGTVVPTQTGWYLKKAEAQDLSVAVQSGYVNAKFKGLYVKPCSSDVWVNIQNTWFAYEPTALYENLVPSVSYLVDITTKQSLATGVQPTTEYDCGGDLLAVKTQIGTVNVRNNTKVTFAYVVEFTK